MPKTMYEAQGMDRPVLSPKVRNKVAAHSPKLVFSCLNNPKVKGTFFLEFLAKIG